MFVHAHPDDETIQTGGTLAALAEVGREPLLVTLTRGERGEVTPGPFAQLAGTDGLAPHRQQELAAALAMLGVERHVFLGVDPARAEGLPPYIYEDSGMVWGPDGRAMAAGDAGDDALTRVPAVEALNDLLAAAFNAGAGAIVSYNDGGGYGHPDHVFAHRLARSVASALGIPFWQIVSGDDSGTPSLSPTTSPTTESDSGLGSDSDPNLKGSDAESADPEHTGLEAHDIAPWFDRKVAALRMHGTQLSVDGTDIVHVGGQREPISPVESFERLGD